MDNQKTGKLIADIRKENGLTQKQLADQLHISDRTISKWERGAGFPDVALIEPLADALQISVAGLLQGERIPASACELTVRESIAVVYKQMRAKARKRVGTMIASIFLFVFFMAFLFAILDYSGAFLKNIEMDVTAGIYVDGIKTAESIVTIVGKRNDTTLDRFTGRFAIDYVEKTCRDGVTACIDWNDGGTLYDTIKYWGYGGTWDSGVLHQLYISENMNAFAIKLEDGTIIATDEYYVPLMMLDTYYPILD